MSRDERNLQLMNSYLKIPNLEMDFVVERNMEVVDRDGLGRGMSPAAMEALHQQMLTWVGTRMMRFHDDHGVMPQVIRVTVAVEMSP